MMEKIENPEPLAGGYRADGSSKTERSEYTAPVTDGQDAGKRGALVKTQDTASLPTLPRNFAEMTAHLTKEERNAEYDRRRAAFNTARAQLRNWTRQDRNPLMNKTAKLVIEYLLECLNFEKGLCFPSHEAIADHLGITDRQVRRLIPRIEAAGWIRAVRVARNKPTFYVFQAPHEAVRRIEEGAAALKQNRDDRREQRRYPLVIEHEPAREDLEGWLNIPKMSAQPHSDRTSVSARDRTSVSGEPLNRTPEIAGLYEEKKDIKVSSAPQSYQDREDDPHHPYPVPTSEAEAVAMLDELRRGANLSAGVLAFFRRKLWAGELTPAMVDEQRRSVA